MSQLGQPYPFDGLSPFSEEAKSLWNEMSRQIGYFKELHESIEEVLLKQQQEITRIGEQNNGVWAAMITDLGPSAGTGNWTYGARAILDPTIFVGVDGDEVSPIDRLFDPAVIEHVPKVIVPASVLQNPVGTYFPGPDSYCEIVRSWKLGNGGVPGACLDNTCAGSVNDLNCWSCDDEQSCLDAGNIWDGDRYCYEPTLDIKAYEKLLDPYLCPDIQPALLAQRFENLRGIQQIGPNLLE